jgi:hypothetical protein
MRRAAAAALVPLAIGCGLLAAGCGEGTPTKGPARVTWVAYPETVVVGKTFPFEIAGPVGPTTCARLDTSAVAVSDSGIVVSARRSVYHSFLCSHTRVSFYVPRPLSVARPGRYPVLAADGRRLGVLVALDSGAFSPERTVGEGTVRHGGGCLLFGPGWASNQRPFSLHGVPARIVALAGTDSVVRVVGDLAGFDQCGGLGSRPVIAADSASVTGRLARDWYAGG